MAENEVSEISKRIKRGNKTSIFRNRIINNSIFGWDFDKEMNYLKMNKEEAKIVKFIYETSLEFGLRVTANLTNEKGYRTKKGNLWSASTIKSLIINPKYKGFNVRQKFNNVNLFTESKTKYVKKEEWIVRKSDRIEAIVSEELWEKVQQALAHRCICGNKGRNARTYDTRGKLKCAKCGASYIRAVENKITKKRVGLHYLICSNKKKYSKSYCDAKNINIEILDAYIEKERKSYYKNIKKQIQNKIKALEKELASMSRDNISTQNNKLATLKCEREKLNNQLDKLIDKFMNMDADTALDDIVNKKIDIVRERLREIEEEYNGVKIKNEDREKYKRELRTRILKVKDQLINIPKNALSRKEWLAIVENILIEGKKVIRTEYKV
ncbi:MAG: recombinase family protein [Sarcina sp.]